MPENISFFSRLGQELLKWRWLCMAGIGLLAISLEVIERIELKILQLNFSFFSEAFLEGVALPVLGGVILTLADRAIHERTRVAYELARK